RAYSPAPFAQLPGDLDRNQGAVAHSPDDDGPRGPCLLDLIDIGQRHFSDALKDRDLPIEAVGVDDVARLVRTQFARKDSPNRHNAGPTVHEEQGRLSTRGLNRDEHRIYFTCFDAMASIFRA